MSLLDAKTSRPLDGGPSFTLGNRLFRLVWMLTWTCLARFTPPPLHRWRALVLRIFGARLGKGVRVHGSVAIWNPRNLELGDRVLIGPGATLYNQGTISIGAYTVVSQRAHICASTHDIRDPNFQLQLRPVRIGTGCWIAAEAFVGPGVTVGDRAVLGARAALFGDAEAEGVYRGNPAERVKHRQMRAE